jgi:hypothetical protein
MSNEGVSSQYILQIMLPILRSATRLRQYWEMYLIKNYTNIHVHLTVVIFNINKYKNVPQVVIEFLTCFKSIQLLGIVSVEHA